ncbi:hypothetical protein LIER_30714 [Lithospermum erythrorhizon]|uniref:Reverse transcriptase RNase H-like domain-containing protein n=1 Tax=Lithospermum erythrorhizon TaxID=34254 RepID=A0AAV3RRZ5_LITER
MRGAETWYPLMEKVAFALIVAVQKLKPYIEAHQVEVITYQPLRQILENPRRSGRIVKWAIELTEFDPRYNPRTNIKPQALAEFMVECTHGKVEEALGLINLIEASQEKIWLLRIDGACNPGGSGAEILLWFPEGNKIEYAIRFAFKETLWGVDIVWDLSRTAGSKSYAIVGLRLNLDLLEEKRAAVVDRMVKYKSKWLLSTTRRSGPDNSWWRTWS